MTDVYDSRMGDVLVDRDASRVVDR